MTTTIAQDGILETTILVPPIEIQMNFFKIVNRHGLLRKKMSSQSEEMGK